MKYQLTAILITLIYCTHAQSNSVGGITIDPNIKMEAEKHFNGNEFEQVNRRNQVQIFQNSVEWDLYENDSLLFSTNHKPKTIISKSLYLWKGDTLFIDGGVGLAVGVGFSIQIVQGQAKIYHMLSSDDAPDYAYEPTSTVLFRINVPCHKQRAIVSEVPIKGSGKIIYGYVEFESEEFYEIKGSGPRVKARSNMKMYFKSGEFKF